MRSKKNKLSLSLYAISLAAITNLAMASGPNFKTIQNNPEMVNTILTSQMNKTDATLKYTSSSKSPLGSSIRYQQIYKGAVVEGSNAVLIFDKNGNYIDNNESLRKLSIEDKVKLSKKKAQSIALKLLKINKRLIGKKKIISKETLKVVNNNGKNEYVWEVAISGTIQAYNIQISAETGEVLTVKDVHTDAGHNIAVHDASMVPFGAIGLLLFGAKKYKIYENGNKVGLGKVTAGNRAKAAYKNFKKVEDFYQEQFNRDGFDNKGHDVKVFINVNRFNPLNLLKFRENAAWVGQDTKMFMIGGGGKMLGKFEYSTDVIAHEYTHAVIDATSALIYEKESGALNEHLADMFGIFVKNYKEEAKEPFMIGDTVVTAATNKTSLRDMEHPNNGLSAQPGHMNEYPEKFKNCTPSRKNDHCGVHNLSGIPNKVGQLIVSSIGWRKARNLYYRVMVDRLLPTSNFVDYKEQMTAECNIQLKEHDCKNVEAAFNRVGL